MIVSFNITCYNLQLRKNILTNVNIPVLCTARLLLLSFILYVTLHQALINHCCFSPALVLKKTLYLFKSGPK